MDGDRVFTVSKKGQVFCLEAASDRVIWERDIAEDPGAKTPDRGDLVYLDLRR